MLSPIRDRIPVVLEQPTNTTDYFGRVTVLITRLAVMKITKKRASEPIRRLLYEPGLAVPGRLATVSRSIFYSTDWPSGDR